MSVVTRFAPSPTGFLHIGGARTALFNWLFARGRGGKFLLRIEDTDRARSTPDATEAILSGLTWLGLDWDGEPVSQFEQAKRHADVAGEMLANGTAYKCFSTQEEIAEFREQAKADGKSTLFQSPWRDVPASDHPDLPFVVRLKTPTDGETTIADAVQGQVTWQNAQLDDMILLRSDGTPTYMHAVVVDDHDMRVTHVIRGDDHLANAARQSLVYDALGWDKPTFAHIPLIHGPDGKKLSKRHGSLGVEEYAAMGYIPAGLRNYLARLGWSHGDEEVFTTDQAKEWFDLEGIGKAPARLDFKKMDHINVQHIAMSDDDQLLADLEHYLGLTGRPPLSASQRDILASALYCVKDRAKTLEELWAKSQFALQKSPIEFDERAENSLDQATRSMLRELTPHLQNASWDREPLEAVVAEFAEAKELKMGKIAAPLRAAISGSAASPSVFDMMMVIGRDETLARIKDL